MDGLDRARWAAVEARDETADGIFFYGVRTTGIYCRPGCPSRRPRRRNVEFFSTSSAAAAAGYRACRRCRPELDLQVPDAVATVVSVCRRLEDPDRARVSAAELAKSVGWSRRHLGRTFKEVTGVTLTAYRAAQLADRARRSLAGGSPVAEAGFDAGYGSMRAAYEGLGVRLGVTPGAFRRGAPGVDVVYGISATALGHVLVASTGRGLCAVRLGDDPDALVQGLEAEFSAADVRRDDAALAGVLGMAADLARGRSRRAVEIPLDIAGTAFQVEVWEALREIPAGTTVSYRELAERIGRPSAHRAVANACAANPVALVVPCHRVVRSDGSIGGYRWGPERKAAILEAEADATRSPRDQIG